MEREKANAEFEKAIQNGRLSQDPQDDNHAGRFMYMGEDEKGRALFKNSLTREYLK